MTDKERQEQEEVYKQYGMNACNRFSHYLSLCDEINRSVNTVITEVNRIIDRTNDLRPILKRAITCEEESRSYWEMQDTTVPKSKLQEILDKIEVADYYGLPEVEEDIRKLLGVKEEEDDEYYE